MRQKQLRSYISTMKILATILVVYVHSENLFGYTNNSEVSAPYRVSFMLNDMAVPIFFTVSGYLLFCKPFIWGQNLKKKIKTLIIPLLCWNTIWFLFELVGERILPSYFDGIQGNSILEFIQSYFGIPFTNTMIYYSPLWFVRDLFMLNLFASVIKYMLLHIKPIIIMFFLFILWFSDINLYARQSICFFVFGGLIGMYWSDIELSKFKAPAIISGILGILLTYYFPNEYVSRLSTLMCMFSCFVIVFCCTRFQNQLERFMPYSFPIYVMHGKILSIVQILSVMIFPQNQLIFCFEYLFIPVCVISLCVFVSRILKHILPTFYAISTGNRIT